MFKGLGLITSYSMSFNSATGIVTGSDGYAYDCNQKIAALLNDPTYKANDLAYSLTEDWLRNHASHCRIQPENKWDWNCISNTVIAPNVLSGSLLPLYPVIDAWIASKRSSVPSGGSGTGSGGQQQGGNEEQQQNDESNPFNWLSENKTMLIVAGAGLLLLMMARR